jgi:hypothetical protein
MMEPTIFSLEGWMELMDEMSKPPADTPERRATFERVRIMRALRERSAASDSPDTRPEALHPVAVAWRYA